MSTETMRRIRDGEKGGGGGGGWGMEVGGDGDYNIYIPITTLSPPE